VHASDEFKKLVFMKNKAKPIKFKKRVDSDAIAKKVHKKR
jgi:hypothetical protein